MGDAQRRERGNLGSYKSTQVGKNFFFFFIKASLKFNGQNVNKETSSGGSVMRPPLPDFVK